MSPSTPDPLATLRRDHPRLMLTPESLSRLRQRVQEEPRLRDWAQTVRQRAGRLLDEPVSCYDIADGKRLLPISRCVVARTYDLAISDLLQNDDRLRDRLLAELSAAAAFPDWNPSHFLDVAEMAHAFAIGYDWLYDRWNDEQRRLLRDAIVRHAFEPALQTVALPRDGRIRWDTAANNWNAVCHGGLGLASLAVADEHPEAAQTLLADAFAKLPLHLKHYAPDGGISEGPAGYWGYGTRYLVYFIASLESATGSDHGLRATPGLSRTALFPIHLSGPTGVAFNFSDGKETRPNEPILFWLAHAFDEPLAARHRWSTAGPQALDLVWAPVATCEVPPPRDALFRGVEAVSFRSAWDDPLACWVAMQCGRNVVGHNQADLGTFVYEAMGVRWAVDLGGDAYNLPGYFGAERYTYYRNRAEGHNVIVARPGADAGQDVLAGGTITRFDPRSQSPTATADLSAAYPALKRYERTIELRGRQDLVIDDDLETRATCDVWWFLHTRATVDVGDDGRRAVLRQAGRELTVRLEWPSDARLQVLPARPLATSPDPQGQNPNDGTRDESHGRGAAGSPPLTQPDPQKAVRKLAVRLGDVERAKIRVVLCPAQR